MHNWTAQIQRAHLAGMHGTIAKTTSSQCQATTGNMSISHPLSGVLFAAAPHPSLKESLSIAFSKLIGSWTLTMRRYSFPSRLSEPLTLEGEWHFGWVLNGLAVQDVWIVP